MSLTSDPRPSREFPREGFTLYLDADGIELRVDDYHPQPLKLSWVLLEQLRRDSRQPRASDESGSG